MCVICMLVKILVFSVLLVPYSIEFTHLCRGARSFTKCDSFLQSSILCLAEKFTIIEKGQEAVYLGRDDFIVYIVLLVQKTV